MIARGKLRSWEKFVPALVIAGFFLIWELLAKGELVSRLFFPAPTKILENFWGMIIDGSMLMHLAATLQRLLAALVLGGIPGILLGLAMGWSSSLRTLVDPLVAALHPIPKIAVFPLIIMFFGIGETSKIVAIAITVFFPCLINSMAAVRQLPPVYFDVARNYGASRFKTFQRVVWPGSLPMVLAGLRIASAVALTVTIAVELLSAGKGLGVVIWFSWQTFRTADLYSALIVIALLGILFNVLMKKMGEILIPWSLDHREGIISG